jgi:hypothetical protein
LSRAQNVALAVSYLNSIIIELLLKSMKNIHCFVLLASMTISLTVWSTGNQTLVWNMSCRRVTPEAL